MTDNLYKLDDASIEFTNRFFCSLGDKVGLSFFAYLRIFNDGSILRYCNNKEWTKIYLMKNFQNQEHFYKRHIEQIPWKGNKKFLWINQEKNVLYSALYELGIWHGISVYEKYEDYIETYSFATSLSNNEIYTTYFNNFDILIKFISSFRKNINRNETNAPKRLLSSLKPKKYMPLKNKSKSIVLDKKKIKIII